MNKEMAEMLRAVVPGRLRDMARDIERGNQEISGMEESYDWERQESPGGHLIGFKRLDYTLKISLKENE